MNKVLEVILLAKQKLVKDMWGLDLSWTSYVTEVHLWLQTTTGNYVTGSKISYLEAAQAGLLDALVSEQVNYMIKALEQKKKDSQEYWVTTELTSSFYWFGWGDSAASTTTGGGGATATVDYAAMAKQQEEYAAKAKAEQEARMPQSLELMYELGWDEMLMRDAQDKAQVAKMEMKVPKKQLTAEQKQAAKQTLKAIDELNKATWQEIDAAHTKKWADLFFNKPAPLEYVSWEPEEELKPLKEYQIAVSDLKYGVGQPMAEVKGGASTAKAGECPKAGAQTGKKVFFPANWLGMDGE